MPHLLASVRSGDLIFLSGQIAFDADGKVKGDIAEQTVRCLEALDVELERHGVGRSSIIKTGVWLTERENYAAFDEAYEAFFRDDRPARSTVIAGLAVEGALVEIDAVAAAPAPPE